MTLITEVLCHRKSRQSDSGSRTGGLIHLAKDQGHLGLSRQINDAGFLHFVVQIITLSRPLSNSSEDRVTTMRFGDIVLVRWGLEVSMYLIVSKAIYHEQ